MRIVIAGNDPALGAFLAEFVRSGKLRQSIWRRITMSLGPWNIR